MLNDQYIVQDYYVNNMLLVYAESFCNIERKSTGRMRWVEPKMKITFLKPQKTQVQIMSNPTVKLPFWAGITYTVKTF
jgi:hypothetical protein